MAISTSSAASGAATMATSFVRILTLSNTALPIRVVRRAARRAGASAPVGPGHVSYLSDANGRFKGYQPGGINP